jgi:hypothetical protein
MQIIFLIIGAAAGLGSSMALSMSSAPVYAPAIMLVFFGLCISKLTFAVANR